jgi:hypothetical protein
MYMPCIQKAACNLSMGPKRGFAAEANALTQNVQASKLAIAGARSDNALIAVSQKWCGHSTGATTDVPGVKAGVRGGGPGHGGTKCPAISKSNMKLRTARGPRVCCVQG